MVCVRQEQLTSPHWNVLFDSSEERGKPHGVLRGGSWPTCCSRCSAPAPGRGWSPRGRERVGGGRSLPARWPLLLGPARWGVLRKPEEADGTGALFGETDTAFGSWSRIFNLLVPCRKQRGGSDVSSVVLSLLLTFLSQPCSACGDLQVCRLSLSYLTSSAVCAPAEASCHPQMW